MKNVPSLAADNVNLESAAMVLFPAGRYAVGSEEGAEAERSVREIELDAFWLDETLTSNEQFAIFAEQAKYQTQSERNGEAWGWRDGIFKMISGLSWRSYAGPGREKHPVILVSWNDAKAYAEWAGKRLPTEWEWEVAAGSGSTTRYPWGDAAPGLLECNWLRAGACPPPTAEVRTFPANQAGLYEMVGNVWQWCDNVFEESNIDLPSLRARRGGAWNVIQEFRLRCANRGALEPSAAAPNLGFRCAMDFSRESKRTGSDVPTPRSQRR